MGDILLIPPEIPTRHWNNERGGVWLQYRRRLFLYGPIKKESLAVVCGGVARPSAQGSEDTEITQINLILSRSIIYYFSSLVKR